MNLRAVAGIFFLAFALTLPGCGGCSKDKEGGGGGGGGGDKGGGEVPVFSLAWSEYPSWSVFGVASELGLINGKKGEQGALEKKWGVDIVLDLLEYDPCIAKYASGKCDAVCVTNIDIMVPAATLKSVAIFPTSTSDGADACLVTFEAGFTEADGKWKLTNMKEALEELKKGKGMPVFGLAKSVSEYAFDRNLWLLKERAQDYKFTDEPPNTAALSMSTNKDDHKAIMVWNPFVLEVLDKNKKAKRLFDSSTLKEEIIDMVVVAEESLKKPKGKEFAYCLAEVYYEMNKEIFSSNQKTADGLLVKLGEKFTGLPLDKMKICVTETKFYKTPEDGLKLFKGDKLPETMKIVTKFCKDKEMIKADTKYDFGVQKSGSDVQLWFDPSYMAKVQATKK